MLFMFAVPQLRYFVEGGVQATHNVGTFIKKPNE